MNIRILIISVFLMSLAVSSCGMKRALTLPKDGEESAQEEPVQEVEINEEEASE